MVITVTVGVTVVFPFEYNVTFDVTVACNGGKKTSLLKVLVFLKNEGSVRYGTVRYGTVTLVG
jgi:hypothetical protein